MIVARDDDGSILPFAKQDGPPPLFPPVELPPIPEVSAEEEKLLAKRRALMSAWRHSPYYLQTPKVKAVGVAADIERYSDRYRAHPDAKRVQLSAVMLLDAAHFPAELLTGAKQATVKDTSAIWRAGISETQEMQRLERLARLEAKLEKEGGERKPEEGKDKEKEGGEGDDDDEAVVEEEEDFGDDDYAQIYGYDDDDEYPENDFGGEDEGPTF
eukprot:jgi/Chlat1/8013/Chrsp7S07760